MAHMLPQGSREPRQRCSNYQQQRQKNQRLALILTSVAATFFVGFMVKMVLLQG